MIQQILVLTTVFKMLKESYKMDQMTYYVWFSNNKLSINDEKSNFMIISSQSNVSNPNIQRSTLNLDGKVLHQIDNISYLGIHFNERLCRKPHVNKLYMKLGKKTKKCYGNH